MTESGVTFSDRELDVMGVLWERGSATVAEVQESLDDRLAYTTVLTVLRTLEEKGHVGHEGKGKAYVYHPLVDREAAGSTALKKVVKKLFAGSAEMLLTQLVTSRKLSPDELRRMRELLDERLKGDAE